MPISGLAQSAGVPMIIPAPSLPGLTYHMGARKEYVYSAAFADYFHGTAAVLYNGDDQFMRIFFAIQFTLFL